MQINVFLIFQTQVISMIAEENLYNKQVPNISISDIGKISLIKEIMKQSVDNFKSYLRSDFYNKKNFNEDSFTQTYVEQTQILIRNRDYPFNVSSSYRDITNQSKGISDFYFYPNEEGVSTASIFSVEAKRLPAPEKYREKEYVIGSKNNGGIERYKTEKHGKGLKKCGLLGFVEKENFDYWSIAINKWITELSETDNSSWKRDERLSLKESNLDFGVLESVAHRTNDDIHLTHIWVSINT